MVGDKNFFTGVLSKIFRKSPVLIIGRKLFALFLHPLRDAGFGAFGWLMGFPPWRLTT